MEKRAVVVEQDSGLRDVISCVLSDFGFEVASFEDAIDFLDFIAAEGVSADIMVIGSSSFISGLELAKGVKKISSVKILGINHQTPPLGVFDDFIERPFRIEEIERAIRNL